MTRVSIALFLAAGAAFGQFSDVAVTDDAAQVYFSTTLRLKYEARTSQYRQTVAIYRILGNRIEPFSDPPAANPYFSIAHVKPRLSGTGDVVAYTVQTRCQGGSSCIPYPSRDVSVLFVRGSEQPAKNGVAQVSANGRFVVSGQQYIDLDNGTELTLPAAPANDRQTVTSDGRVLLRDGPTGLQLWSPSGGSRRLAVSRAPVSAIINDTGAWVIYESDPRTGSPTELWSFEVNTGREVLLANEGLIGRFRPTMSNLAEWVLYVEGEPRQAFLVRPDGSGKRQLTHFAEGVSDAVLAGFGTAAVVSTPGGRLVRIDVITGAVTDLLGRTPVYHLGAAALTPGSILPLRGTGLAETTAWASFPLPDSLAGVRVFVNGRRLPILSVSPAEIWFQVPFDLPIGDRVTVELANNSVFANATANTPYVVSRLPYFFSALGAGLSAAHEDFSGQVTFESPARPGEIVHIYAVGLGAVSPAVPTGVPAPLDTLHRLSEPFDCTTAAGPAVVLFAGLAPGFIGLYQVDVRIPTAATPGSLFLSCGTPGNPMERHGGSVPIR